MKGDHSGRDERASEPERRIILDACVVLNLYASRRIAEILLALPVPCAVASYVRDREALMVGRHRSGPTADVESVDLYPLIKSGLLEVLDLHGDDENAHFIDLASSTGLDDGEAASGALAHSRGFIVATDDRAAISAFQRHDPPIPTRSTASILKQWAERAAVDGDTLKAALMEIRERANFEPGARDPLQAWWRAV